MKSLKKISLGIAMFIITFYLYKRYNAYITGDVNALDIAMAGILMAILLIQFVAEINVGDFSLKIKDAEENIKTKMEDISETILANINLSNQNNVNIQISESKLQEVNKIIGNDPNTARRGDIKIEELLEVDEVAARFYFIRRTLEAEMNRIGKNKYGMKYKNIRDTNIIQKLIGEDLLKTQFFNMYRDVRAVCTNVIHGKKPSDNEKKFVYNTGVYLIQTLKEIK